MEFFFVDHGVQMKSEVDVVVARLPRFARNDKFRTLAMTLTVIARSAATWRSEIAALRSQ
jgi:hypothetical protein